MYSQALRLAPNAPLAKSFPTHQGYVNVSGCPQVVDKQMWGMWIDGRDALKGMNAYGNSYHDTVMSTLQHVYQMVPGGSDVDLNFYEQVKQDLQSSWEGSEKKNKNLVDDYCVTALPKVVFKEVMSTVKVLNEEYHGVYDSTGNKQKQELTMLFADYTEKVRWQPGRKVELLALAQLMQNIAFLRPLDDQNGRSRMALAQYVIRQRHLGCGAMQYNNNKNIFFVTALQYAELLDEAIHIYDQASEAQFSTNPWQFEETQQSHRSRFPIPEYMADVNKCWHSHINPADGRGVPTSFSKDIL